MIECFCFGMYWLVIAAWKFDVLQTIIEPSKLHLSGLSSRDLVGGEGVLLNKVLYGEAPSGGSNPYSLIY